MKDYQPHRADIVPLAPVRLGDKMRRGFWQIAWLVLFRPSPVVLHGWRRWLLRRFGARIAKVAYIYPATRIWAPWNLTMGPLSCLAARVECYNVLHVSLGPRALVSQGAHLCTASHDFDVPEFPLVGAPITLGEDSWVTADVFVGPGVAFGRGSVALARAVVTRSVPEWTVVAGNPARAIRKRQGRLREECQDG